MSTEKKRKRFRISGKLIFNIIVLGITFYLIVFFCVSENGMIDLLSSPDGFIWGWIIAGIVAFDMNIVIDSIVTQILIRIQYPDFRFIDALKVALVGVFFRCCHSVQHRRTTYAVVSSFKNESRSRVRLGVYDAKICLLSDCYGSIQRTRHYNKV